MREYDFGDTAGTTPLLMMHTLGHAFMPPPVHAGGLRYHGSAPFVSHLLVAGTDRSRGVRTERRIQERAHVRALGRDDSRA